MMLTVLSIVTMAACAEAVSPISNSKGAELQLARAGAVSLGDSLAISLATGLAHESMRGLLRDVMRESPVNEHKVVLQDFVATAVGQQFLAISARESGLDVSQLHGMVHRLPRLDMYLPFESHRLTWRGTGDIGVAVVFEDDAPTVTAFGVDGTQAVYRLADGLPTQPLLILHPEEPKQLRAESAVSPDRGVIQNGPETVLGTYTAPNGLTYVVGADAPASLTTGGVYIDAFNVQEGDGWFGDSEMRFVALGASGTLTILNGVTGYAWHLFSGGTCDLGTYTQGGIKEDIGYNTDRLLSPGVTSISPPPCGQYYTATVIEDDGGLNGGNDNFGIRLYTGAGCPAGAVINVVQSHYKDSNCGGTRGAYLHLKIIP